MKITFLGTGTSVGVPAIGCTCKVCQSKDPHDKRLRASAMVETERTRILIDPGPDFRQQMLGQSFRKIDAVLVTHIHYDHVGGLDDIRPFCQFGEVNVYADEITSRALMNTVPYCFAENRYPGAPKINLHTLQYHQHIQLNELEVIPFCVYHDKLPITGFRIQNLVYITDMKTMDDSELPFVFKVMSLRSMTFVTTRPIKQACWRSLLRKFKVQLLLELSIELPYEKETVEHTGTGAHQPLHTHLPASTRGQRRRLRKQLLA